MALLLLNTLTTTTTTTTISQQPSPIYYNHHHLKLKLNLKTPPNTTTTTTITSRRRRSSSSSIRSISSCWFNNNNNNKHSKEIGFYFRKKKSPCSTSPPVACSNDIDDDALKTQSQSSFDDDDDDVVVHTLINRNSSNRDYDDNVVVVDDGFPVSLFIRMLGLDYDLLDRQKAAYSLWKYSLGGNHCVDNILKSHPPAGNVAIINLLVNLLKSDDDDSKGGAAGLLSVISSFPLYTHLFASTGAIEEITSLLATPSSLSSNVKEQAVSTLFNLSLDDTLTHRICNFDTLPLLVNLLDDEDIKVKEAAVGVVANLTLNHSCHKMIVDQAAAGLIPKLAKLLKGDVKEYKVIRKIARNALLELAKDEYTRILIMEEGLVLVPLVGLPAYKSFTPSLYSWPSLPDGTSIEQTSNSPSRYGASELLLGLNVQNENAYLEEAKINAVVGRTRQQFLARIGAIELDDDDKKSEKESPASDHRLTILPLIDGVARLVLILGLEDESAIARAAGSIADASINEHMRTSFKEAGAIKHLVQLINHPSGAVRLAAIRALDRLSISNHVCQTVKAEGVLHPLVNSLKQPNSEISSSLITMILNILTRILDPNKYIKSKLYVGPVTGSKKGLDTSIHPTSVYGNEMIASKLTSSTQNIAGEDLIDLTFLSCLVDILKTSNPDLQRKAASVLEFIVVIEPCAEEFISAGIETGLEFVFQQKALIEKEYDDTDDGANPEVQILDLEEAGLAVSAASRLLTKLLDFDQFRHNINSNHFTKLLRAILVSGIPLQYKDWVAACLVKLTSLFGQNENSVNMEVVTYYERVPRLIEQIKSSIFSPEVQEAAVLELNKIICDGVMDPTTRAAVASAEGGILSLVKLMESGSNRAGGASLAILYNLSMDSENHAAIISAGAVPVLRKFVLLQKPQWMLALCLLRNLPTY